MKGLFKKLALAAPLVACLPLCALAGEPAASDDDAGARIFEDYSSAGSPMLAPRGALADSSAPCVGIRPPPPAPCAASVGRDRPNCCNTSGEPFFEPAC